MIGLFKPKGERMSAKSARTLGLRITMIVVIMTAICIGNALAQINPEEHFKKGELLLKSGLPYEAFDEFAVAVRLDPKNSKYQKKLTEAGRVASAKAESEALKYLKLNAAQT